MNKEERKVYMDEYRKTQKWKESKQKSDKKYYQNNKEAFLKRNRTWKENNIEQFYKTNKKWVENNPEKVKEIQQRYRENNPYYKVRNLFHNLKKKNYKNITKPEFIQIKEHIESQFQPYMDWTNTEIDHKIPISWFIKETPTKIINDLRNLHPLLKEENGKKSSTFCHSISSKYFNIIFSYIKEERIAQLKSALSL
jgi:hypothetical protein